MRALVPMYVRAEKHGPLATCKKYYQTSGSLCTPGIGRDGPGKQTMG